ncbi:hypothetical protein RB595_008168 [Gaeumannomyces hyphopodioides]
MLSTTTFFVALLSIVSALPTEGEHAWKPAGPNDSRSPCPMLNALANHGFLPRDGRNISMAQFITGLQDGVNLDESATRLVATIGMEASTTGNPNTVHLADLNKHGVIEHDGSLSRADTVTGDNHSFNKDIFAFTVSQWPADKITIEHSAKSRNARLADAKAKNPTFALSARAVQGSLLENALIQVVFGEGVNGNADKKMVTTFFEKEQLPYELGYKRPDKSITLGDCQNVIGKILAVPA